MTNPFRKLVPPLVADTTSLLVLLLYGCSSVSPIGSSSSNHLFFFFFFFLAALGLRCCAQAFSSRRECRLLFAAVHGLLIVVASLVAEHGL